MVSIILRLAILLMICRLGSKSYISTGNIIDYFYVDNRIRDANLFSHTPSRRGGGGRKGGRGDARYLIFGRTELIQPLIGAGEGRGVNPA